MTLQQLRDEPLPCFFPSCVSKFKDANEGSSVRVEEQSGGWIAECQDCCGGTGSFESKDAAIDEWNKVAQAVLTASSDPKQPKSSDASVFSKPSSGSSGGGSDGGAEFGEPRDVAANTVPGQAELLLLLPECIRYLGMLSYLEGRRGYVRSAEKIEALAARVSNAVSGLFAVNAPESSRDSSSPKTGGEAGVLNKGGEA